MNTETNVVTPLNVLAHTYRWKYTIRIIGPMSSQMHLETQISVCV